MPFSIISGFSVNEIIRNKKYFKFNSLFSDRLFISLIITEHSPKFSFTLSIKSRYIFFLLLLHCSYPFFTISQTLYDKAFAVSVIFSINSFVSFCTLFTPFFIPDFI